jgi:hypothetical protein
MSSAVTIRRLLYVLWLCSHWPAQVINERRAGPERENTSGGAAEFAETDTTASMRN